MGPEDGVVQGRVGGGMTERFTGAEDGVALDGAGSVDKVDVALGGSSAWAKPKLGGACDSGMTGSCGPEARITGGLGAGHPHSIGTLASTWSSRPRWNTSWSVALR